MIDISSPGDIAFLVFAGIAVLVAVAGFVFVCIVTKDNNKGGKE